MESQLLSSVKESLVDNEHLKQPPSLCFEIGYAIVFSLVKMAFLKK